MVDKVKPLKLEDSTSGTELNFLPTEVDPSEDYIAGKGFAFENLDTVYFKKSGSDIVVKDLTLGTEYTLNALRTALSNSFDNTTNSFVATNVQAAIEEARDTAQGLARATVVAGYGGQAKGKYLEFFKGLSSDTSPYVFSEDATIKAVSCSFSATPIGTIILYINSIQIDVYTMTALTYVESGLSFNVNAGDKMSLFGDNNGSTTLSNPCFSVQYLLR